MKARKAYILLLILFGFYLFPVAALAKIFCYQEYSVIRCILSSTCYTANSVFSPDLRSDTPDDTCDLATCSNTDQPLRLVSACQIRPDNPFYIATGLGDESYNPAFIYGNLQILIDNHILDIPLYLLKASLLC